MKRKLTLIALASSTAFLTACGGGGPSGGASNNGDNANAAQQQLCPSSLNYSTSWIGGSGAGELIKVQLDTTAMTWQITFLESVVPAAAGTAEPSRSDPTAPTADRVMTGTLGRVTQLPEPNLNACAFTLNGAYVTATNSSGQDTFDNGTSPASPTTPAPLIFVGQGIMGGAVPGKEIQYAGVNIGNAVANEITGTITSSIPIASVGSLLQSAMNAVGLTSLVGTVVSAAVGSTTPVGTIPDTTFRYFPFLAFSQLDSSMSQLSANKYTQLGFSLLMTANANNQTFTTNPINAAWTFGSGGSYTRLDQYGQNAGKTISSGANDSYGNPVNLPFVQSADATGVFETDNYQGEEPPTPLPALANDLYPTAPSAAGKGYLIMGKMPSGADVPVLIRRGVVAVPSLLGGPDGNNAHVDDEVGMSILAPQTTVSSGSIDGLYVALDANLDTLNPPGSTSPTVDTKGNQFDYLALLLSGSSATLANPFNIADPAGDRSLTINYAGQTTPGLLPTATSIYNGSGASVRSTTGSLISGGGAAAYLEVPQGAGSPNYTAAPYFAAGVYIEP